MTSRTAFKTGLTGCLSLALLAGCASHDSKYTYNTYEPDHGSDIAGNWDPSAAKITLEPSTAVNQVQTQHVLIATVANADGTGLGGRRVEWILPAGGVGAIVAVDEHGVYTHGGDKDESVVPRSQTGDKHDNAYAVTHTTHVPERIDFGTADPSDDVLLAPGQTWIAITSATEGTTDVVAYAPGIDSWKDHKAFAAKHWMDVAWEWPSDATNRVGTGHELSTLVVRASDGGPLAGYTVSFHVASGPDAVLEPGGKADATVKTDANGLATVTLEQSKPVAGTNEVEISIVRPANEKCCEPEKFIALGTMRKTWIAPTIGITKTAPKQAVVGETFDYAIVVTNDADVSTREVVVTDVLPEGIAYVSSTPAAKVDGSRLTWNVGELAAGGTTSLGVKVKASKTGKFTNCADVAAEAGLKARACADTVVVAPALQLQKTADAEVLLCDTITYRYVVRNTGDGDATNVRIADELPAGLTAAGGGRNVNVAVGTLGPGESRTYEVKASAGKTGEYVNKATATGDGGLSAEATAKTVVRQPVLTITKKAPERSFIGRPVTYEITVSNTGDAVSANTVLVDTLPTGAVFQNASDGGQHVAGKVTWNLGNLAPKASKSVTLRVVSNAAGRASVQGTCAAEATAQASTLVEGISALLLEVVDLDDPIEVGSNATYEIVVTNQGSAPGSQIVIAATLPAEMTFVSASGASQHTATGKTITFAPVGTLAPQAKLTFRITVRADAAGDVRFAVALNSAELTSPVDETEATQLY
jgi:uncharacterized repeat protein (TIGR01451 family)